jgi:excisionase family DNA binding protein
MTKDEVAELLEVSTRQVERFTSAGRLSVTYERGTTRKVPVYVRSDVERLKDEIENTTHARPAFVPAESQQTGIATISDRGASQLSELVAILRDAADSSRQREDQPASITDLAHKLTLSLMEASQLSGLSRNHLRQAIEEKKLKARIIGRGWRVKREDLDAYVRKL